MNPNPETDLFGAPPAPKTRYGDGTRTTPKLWSPQEDLSILPVLLACESELAYLEACRFLAETLGRFSRPAGNPTSAQITQGCVSLIERRAVGHLLAGRPEATSLSLFLFGAHRGGAFTWAEMERIIKPYSGKSPLHRVAAPSLLLLLERPYAYLDTLKDAIAKPTTSEQKPLAGDKGRPARPSNREALGSAVLAFRDANPNDEYALTQAWAALHKTATA